VLYTILLIICVFLFQLNKPGRLDTDTVPTLQNKADIMDFAFDPFDNTRLLSGTPISVPFLIQ